MAAIGFLDWAYDVVTGKAANPIKKEGVGDTIRSIQTFGDELNTTTKEAWKNLYNELFYSVNRQGTRALTTSFLNEWALQSTVPMSDEETYQSFGQLVETELTRRGAKYVFSDSFINDPESKNPGKVLKDIQDQIQFADEAQGVYNTLQYAEKTFIDPYPYSDLPEAVPHSAEIEAQRNLYNQAVLPGKYIEKILAFVRRNPTKFNASTIITAFKREQDFMTQVNNKWNDKNISRSILEGDPTGTFQALLGDGVNVTKDVISEVADDTLGSDLSPVKPIYDLFKDLWDNAGTYIEIVGVVAVTIVLLYIAGEIKTVVR